MAAFDKIGDQSIKDAMIGLQLLLTELNANLNGLMDRIGGAKITISIELPPWSPKA